MQTDYKPFVVSYTDKNTGVTQFYRVIARFKREATKIARKRAQWPTNIKTNARKCKLKIKY